MTPGIARIARAALGLGLLGLSGCVTLLPTSKAAQLYRFGAESAAPVAGNESEATAVVHLDPIDFTPAAAGDQIQTTQGDETAYIGAARWVTSAGALFEAAIDHAFDAGGGTVRLQARAERGPADFDLKIDVRTFEARYAHGPGAAPDVVVEVYSSLSPRKESARGAARIFEADVPAESNSVHAIVAAFDKAVAKVLGDIIAWVDKTATP